MKYEFRTAKAVKWVIFYGFPNMVPRQNYEISEMKLNESELVERKMYLCVVCN